MKKVVRLNENDIERLVGRIIKEDSIDEGVENNFLSMLVENTIKEEDGEQNSPRDVEKFLQVADQYFFSKYGKYAEKIDTPVEKAQLLAALAKKWGVSTDDLSRVKSVLQQESVKSRKPINEININNTVKKIKARGKAEDYEIERVLDYVRNKVGGEKIGNSINGDGFTINTTNTGFSVNKLGGKKMLFGYDQIGDMSKYIKESDINEVGGYDDPNIMGRHAGQVLGILTEVVKGIVMGLMGLDQLVRTNEKGDIMSNITHLIDAIEEGITLMTKAITDFTEDELIDETRSVIGKLKRFNRQLRVLETMGHGYSETDFMKQIIKMSDELIKDLNSYIKHIIKTDRLFTTRIQGNDRGGYNQSRDYFNN